MKDTTKDTIALELIIIATVVVGAIILAFLLRMTSGVFLPFTATMIGLYFVRWVGWAIHRCQSRADLRHAFAKVLLPIVFMIGLGGTMLLVTGIRHSSFPLAIVSLCVLVGSALLDHWRRKTLVKGSLAHEEAEGIVH